MQLKQLEKRILDLSYAHGLTHIGSCLTALPIILNCYKQMNLDDKFVLSAGHSALALYVVLEYFGYADAEELIKKSGTHPDRLVHNSIICSTGSLGQGLPVAVGMALADNRKDIFCMISDGEAAEGSVWEAMRFVRSHPVRNLTVFCNLNGYTAYGKSSRESLAMLPHVEFIDTSGHWFMRRWGLEAHYRKLSNQDYAEALRHVVE